MKHLFSIILALLVSINVYSEIKPTIELNDLFIGQGDYAITNTYGKPNEVITDDDLVRFFYDNNNTSYIVYGFIKTMPHILFSIQITGENAPDIKPFLGIQLGSDKNDILNKIGSPTSIETINYRIAKDKKSIPSELYRYSTANYSFILQNDKVVSIKLEGLNGFRNETPNMHPMFLVVNAFKIPNYNMFMLCLMPNMEIQKGSKTIQITEPFGIFVNNKNSEMFKQLVTENDSLQNALFKYKFSEPFMRFDHGEMFLVMTGIDDNPIHEILFTVWADTFRISKIIYQ